MYESPAIFALFYWKQIELDLEKVFIELHARWKVFSLEHDFHNYRKLNITSGMDSTGYVFYYRVKWGKSSSGARVSFLYF